MSESESLTFLRTLWPRDNPDAHLVACTGKGPRELKPWFRCTATDLEELAYAVDDQGVYHNVWVNVCGLGANPRGRGRQEHVRFVPGVWADVDSKYIEDPVRFLRGLGEWRPSLIVWTGNGAQAYWLYEPGPLDLDHYAAGDVQRLRELQGRAAVQSARWIEWLKTQSGTPLDPVGDLARVLRVPGTNNVKDEANPKPVRIVEVNGRFPPEAFRDLIQNLQVAVPRDWSMTPEQAAAAFARRGTIADDDVTRIIDKWRSRLVTAVQNRVWDNSRDRSAWWWCRQMNDLCVPPDVAYQVGLEELKHFPTTDANGDEDPLDEGWWRSKIDSAYSYAPREPPRLMSVEELMVVGGGNGASSNGGSDGGDDGQSTTVIGGRVPADPLTDTSVRDHLIRLHGENVRCCGAMGWLVWGDGVWTPDGKECPRTRELYEDAAEDYRDVLMTGVAGNEQATNDVRRTSRSWMTDTRTVHILNQARQRVWVDFTDLNTVSHMLNCPNGEVDLRTGELLPSDKNHLFTQRTTCEYVPWDDLLQADRDRFLRYLASSTRESQPLMDGIQRAAGYTLTGETTEDKLFLVWGVRRSGKSTLVDGLLDVLGRGGFSEQVKPDILMSSYKTRGNVDDAVAQAARARMIATFEPERGERFAEGLLKTATGGEAMSARALYMSTFTFRPRWKIWVATNTKPGSMDPAVHARLVFLPFQRSFEGHEDVTLRPWIRDPDGGARVLLSWAVLGAVEWYGNGPSRRVGVRPQDIPEHVESLAIYREDEDPVSVFVREWLEQTGDQSRWLRTVDMYTHYVMWCGGQGERPMGKKAFFHAMEERGHFRGRDGAGQLIWVGLGLRSMSISEAAQLRYEM